MKKLSYLFLLFAVLLSACGSLGPDPNPNPDPPYNISISPATVDNLNNSIDTSFLSFVPVNTGGETVSFYITGLPPGITVDSSQSIKGTLPFHTIIVFKNNGRATAGIYKLKLNCFTYTLHTYKTYDLSLNVLPAATGSNCMARMLGDWPRCWIDSTDYSDHLVIDPVDPSLLQFDNGNNAGLPIDARLNCTDSTFSIAHSIRVTASGWHYFSGSGTFTANLMTYSFQDSTSTGIQRYTVTMRR